jgi:hypothetical protein
MFGRFAPHFSAFLRISSLPSPIFMARESIIYRAEQKEKMQNGKLFWRDPAYNTSIL